MTKGIFSTPDEPCDSVLMRWVRDHRDYALDYCLIWPFSRARSGYGSTSRDGKVFYIHRYMCEYRNGPSPSPAHHAAHSCGRGQDGCVNPLHLSWKTNSENQLDRREHGANVPGALTPEQVVEIIAGQDTELAAAAAHRFGVSETTVRQIRASKIWRGGGSGRRYLNAEERAEVLVKLGTMSVNELAREYGCGRSVIYKIKNCKHPKV